MGLATAHSIRQGRGKLKRSLTRKTAASSFFQNLSELETANKMILY
jgi:hypothetical protein